MRRIGAEGLLTRTLDQNCMILMILDMTVLVNGRMECAAEKRHAVQQTEGCREQADRSVMEESNHRRKIRQAAE